MAKKSVIILIVILVAVIAAAGVIIAVNNANSGTHSTTQQTTPKLGFDPNAGEFKEQVVAGARGISVHGITSLTIPANKREVIVDFYNPADNAGYYDQTFELKLADGESLSQSQLVRGGEHLQNITLSRGLPAGTYDAILHVQPYTADDSQTPKNNVDIKLKLIVE